MLGTSWKTTAASILPIVGAAYHLASMAMGTSAIDSTQMMVDLGVLSSGVGLLFAKDHNVSNAATPVAAKTVS